MAKKQEIEVAGNIPRTSGGFDYSEADGLAAISLGIVISGTLEDRIGRAVYAFNNATRYAVEAGYLLLSVRAEVERGQFESGIADLGLTSQRASELMRMAKFATALPEDRRSEMLMLPKSKVLALAGADQEVIADLLDKPDSDLVGLSVRDLRDTIARLTAEKTDLVVQRDTAEAERDGAVKKLKKRSQREDDEGVPVVMADIRSEVACQIKKAELAVQALQPLGVELMGYAGHAEAGQWVEPSARMALSGLVALRVITDGVIKSFVEAQGLRNADFVHQADPLAFLTPEEVLSLATQWPELVALHSHEKALREHEREQAKPRGRGRPSAAPEAPKSLKAKA